MAAPSRTRLGRHVESDRLTDLHPAQANHSYPLLWCFPTIDFLGAERSLSLGDWLFGIELIEILQSLLAPYSWILAAVTVLGDDRVLVGLSAVIYWCFDKRGGRLVTYVLLFGAYLNFFLKLLVPWPRPPVDLRIVEKSETSNGFPSGHVQDSATFWAWISVYFRKQSLAVLGTVIVVAVGISRVYLGMHYLEQVIGGCIIGLAVAGIGIVIPRHLPPRTQEISVMLQVLFAAGILAPLAVAAMLGAVGEGNPGQIGGYLFGFWLGTLAEARYVRFTTDTSAAQKIIRIVIGGAIVGLLVLTLGQIFPENYLPSSFSNSVIRGLAVALIVPVLFNTIEHARTGKSAK